jgi:glutamine amidotransferase
MLTNQVCIIDYGLGNLYSVARAVQYLGFNAEIVNDPNKLKKASHVILPGVGAFTKGMEGLIKNGWVENINQYIDSGKPFLGICLGMQLLFQSSEEGGNTEGLARIPGRVVKIPISAGGKKYKIPHVGWNKLIFSEKINYQNTMHGTLPEECSMYFVHSYYAHTDNKYILATCQYFENCITALIQKENVLGCQFHPEKSGKQGLLLLNNFIQSTL